jgi:ElaB/YqjD/DUF883 family membrane-anchored ribosome-binding protein
MSNDLRKKAEARYSEARAKVSDAVSTGRTKADEAIKTARVKADDALTTAKEKAGKAAEATRTSAKVAATKTSDSIQANPLIALGGGLALGAIVAALLPKSEKEDALLGKAGKTLRDTASNAAEAARSAGKGQLDNLGINADAAKDQVRSLVEKLGEAVKTAGSAAADSVRKK